MDKTISSQAVQDEDSLTRRAAQLHAPIREVTPQQLAANTAAAYHPTGHADGQFHLQLWGSSVLLDYPQLVARDQTTGEPLNSFDQALLAYYFHLSDGTPQASRWIAFTELPDGQFYTQAFQGYTGDQLARTFQNDLTAFKKAALALGGEPQPLGDLAFSFRALPHISLLAVCWLGDEDFPSSYRILFDASVSHHLSTDACAILGSTLARKLIKIWSAHSHEIGH